MILNAIKDNFVGYITIFGLDCFFALSEGYSLKIVPKPEEIELFQAKCKERSFNFDSLGWIHAVNDSGDDIAFFLSERQIPFCYYKDTLILIADMIFQTSNNKSRNGEYLQDYKDLKGFTAIDFSGEAVDSVFFPKLAIKEEVTKDNCFERQATDKYAINVQTELNGEKCSLIFSVIVDRQDWIWETRSLGELHSVIRLEFDNRQDMSMIEPSWQAVCTFLAFCMGQFNVTDLNIGLWDSKDKKIGTKGFLSNIYGKINNDKGENIQFRYPAYCRFQADFLGEKVGCLFKLLSNKDTRPILSFLSRNNYEFDVGKNNIRDICSSLEVEYKYKKEDFPNSNVVSLVGKLKQVVKEYRKENPNLLNNDTYSYINSSLEFISLPAKEKLWRIYEKYSAIINEIYKFFGSSQGKDFSKEQTIKDIGWMVKVRNNITHSVGYMEAEIPNYIYNRLIIAVYCSILERSGYSILEIADIMEKYCKGSKRN
ncbi:MAG: hypothetical protein LBS21_12965 [Clostridiales bacterium]|jgi:hypothetical protein|nr:hypothetical protein [Clostridiales bacterium]